MRAKEKGVPVFAFGVALFPDSEPLLDCGISAMFSTVNGPMTLEYAMEHTDILLKKCEKCDEGIFRTKECEIT